MKINHVSTGFTGIQLRSVIFMQNYWVFKHSGCDMHEQVLVSAAFLKSLSVFVKKHGCLGKVM